jgi:hypothetical protein
MGAELKIPLIELRKMITLDKRLWENIFSTNCYAYALGLDIAESEICDSAYVPGTISKSQISLAYQELFRYSELLECLYSDFDALGIAYREVLPQEQINTNEWKIALFTTRAFYSDNIDLLEDYHFLRQLQNGNWYHKAGWYNYPTNKDNYGNIITNPTDFNLSTRTYRKVLCLKLK